MHDWAILERRQDQPNKDSTMRKFLTSLSAAAALALAGAAAPATAAEVTIRVSA